MPDLAGRVALVTGSSRGIGRGIALALARAGADVAVHYRSRAADAESARHEIEVDGAKCERWVLPDWYGRGGYLALDDVGPRLVSF